MNQILSSGRIEHGHDRCRHVLRRGCVHADAHTEYCVQRMMCMGCHARMEGYVWEKEWTGWEVGHLGSFGGCDGGHL